MALERMNMLHCGQIGRRAPVFGKVRELLSDSVFFTHNTKVEVVQSQRVLLFFFLLVSLFFCFCFVLAFCNANQEFLVFSRRQDLYTDFFLNSLFFKAEFV